jgi:hypothetical protein
LGRRVEKRTAARGARSPIVWSMANSAKKAAAMERFARGSPQLCVHMAAVYALPKVLCSSPPGADGYDF